MAFLGVDARAVFGKLAWIAGGSAVSRGSVASALLLASVVLPLDEFGLLSIYLAVALMATQTIGYSVSLFILKSGGLFARGAGAKVRGLVGLVSFVSAATFLLLAALFIPNLRFEYAVVFFAYVLGNCAHQCLVASLQGQGDFRTPTRISSAVITIAAIVSVLAGQVAGGVAIIAALTIGFLVSAAWMASIIRKCETAIDGSAADENFKVLSEVIAIGVSGLLWGALSAWLISDLSRVSGLESAAFYAFGGQFRAALAFIPGVVGVYLVSNWARGLGPAGSDLRQLLFASAASAGAVLGAGLMAVLAFVALKDVLGFKALNSNVLVLSLAAAVVVAAAMPLVRWISVHHGDWINAIASLLSVSVAYLFAQVGGATPEWRTAAFLVAYFAQLIISTGLITHLRRKIDDSAIT